MKYPVETIRKFGSQIFEKAGLSPEDAAVSMDCLIMADLRGMRTHGTTHMKDYCRRVSIGTTAVGVEPEIVETAPSTLAVDAKHTIGMATGLKVMRRCIENAKKTGTCVAAVHNGCHYGLGAYFPMKAAEEGMIGFSFANTPPLVAPFGSAEPLLGTNPISIVIPADRYPDLVLDMATSLVAKGKISLALKERKAIPEGWALDKDGAPTTDPAAANVGALLPFGQHKGYALCLIVSLLSFALSGADMDIDIPRFFEETEKITNVGYFMGAIDISKFCPVDVFKSRVDRMFDVIKNSRPAVGFREVLIPGELEVNMTKKSLEEGIDLSEATLKDFRVMSEMYGVEYVF